ncbi:MAG: hypothetical protein ACYDD2_03945 [Candidatus Acidiferrales bacterium]
MHVFGHGGHSGHGEGGHQGSRKEKDEAQGHVVNASSSGHQH